MLMMIDSSKKRFFLLVKQCLKNHLEKSHCGFDVVEQENQEVKKKMNYDGENYFRSYDYYYYCYFLNFSTTYFLHLRELCRR